MSCNCNDCNCEELRSLIQEYVDLLDDDSVFDDDEWSDRVDEVLNRIRFLLSTS